MAHSPIKLSAPATREFWAIEVLHEDDELLALNKPPCLLSSPDRYDPTRPNLIKLLHAGIAEGKPWARERGLSYLANVHRLDFETSGVILLAKNKPSLVALANLFSAGKPVKTYVALVAGGPVVPEWELNAPLAPDTVRVGRMRIDSKHGKQACTRFAIRESFRRFTLLQCQPLTGRTHQIRVHLKHARLPICGDTLYGGRPLLLSQLKPGYRLKPGRTERPLVSTVALHAERLVVSHPVTAKEVVIEAPWPKDLVVALKYLRLYGA